MVILFHFRFKYKFQDIDKIREEYKRHLNSCQGPLIICSNHLTLIDSIIQSLGLNSILGHLRRYSGLPWNLPEKNNFYHNTKWKIICYLGKCIPVVRMASASDGKKSMNKMLYVLNKGDVLSIFPEGKRSRSGKIDDVDFSYGAGQLIKDIPHANVLCIYLRGKKQGGFANFPSRGEEFYFKMDLINPYSQESGLRKARDLSRQIIEKLKIMEQEYFNDIAICR